MPSKKYTHVQIAVINPEILRSSRGDIEQSIAVNYIWLLMGVSREDVLQQKGDALAHFVSDYATGVEAVSYDGPVPELWENPRTLLRNPNKVTFYYCCNCGTALRPGTCNCGSEVIDIEALRDNPAPRMPGFAYRQIVMKNNRGDGPKPMWDQPRYQFPMKPDFVD